MNQVDDEIEIETCPHFHFARRGQELHFCHIHMVRMCSACWHRHELLHLHDPEFRTRAEKEKKP